MPQISGPRRPSSSRSTWTWNHGRGRRGLHGHVGPEGTQGPPKVHPQKCDDGRAARHDEWDSRRKAPRDLIGIGRPAVARLSEAAQSRMRKSSARATHILKQIASGPRDVISAGVVGGESRLPVALEFRDQGKNRSSLKYKSVDGCEKRVTWRRRRRRREGPVGRRRAVGTDAGRDREVGFSIFKGTACP